MNSLLSLFIRKLVLFCLSAFFAFMGNKCLRHFLKGAGIEYSGGGYVFVTKKHNGWNRAILLFVTGLFIVLAIIFAVNLFVPFLI